MSARTSASEIARRRMLDAHGRMNRQSTRAAWQAWHQAAAEYWVALHPDLAAFRRGDPARTITGREMRFWAEQIRLAQALPTSDRLPPSLANPERMAQIGWLHEIEAGLYESVNLAIKRLRTGDATAIETALQFLEADPYCLRSGYMKSDAIRFLVRAALDDDALERLRSVVLMVVDGYDRREFRAYVRLARRVDSDGLRRELGTRANAADPRTRRHAQWMLAGLGAVQLRPTFT